MLARTMQYEQTMNVALTTSHGRMAPCFSGVELRVVGPGSDPQAAEIVATRVWHPLVWGRELMCRDVNTLLCAGIDQVVWAGIRGYGIEVIPNVMGDMQQVLRQWLNSRSVTPQKRPIPPHTRGFGLGQGDGGNRRFRGVQR